MDRLFEKICWARTWNQLFWGSLPNRVLTPCHMRHPGEVAFLVTTADWTIGQYGWNLKKCASFFDTESRFWIFEAGSQLLCLHVQAPLHVIVGLASRFRQVLDATTYSRSLGQNTPATFQIFQHFKETFFVAGIAIALFLPGFATLLFFVGGSSQAGATFPATVYLPTWWDRGAHHRFSLRSQDSAACGGEKEVLAAIRSPTRCFFLVVTCFAKRCYVRWKIYIFALWKSPETWWSREFIATQAIVTMMGHVALCPFQPPLWAPRPIASAGCFWEMVVLTL